MTCTKQLEANIAFCIDELDLDNDHIGEMLRCIERLGISSVEYFCEEFVFICEDDEGNDIDGCDWDETDEAACTAAGGDYDNGEECSVWTFTKN